MTISVIEEGEALVNWFAKGKVNSHTFFLAELMSLPVKELIEEQLSAMVLKK